jgi:hypothetical protein
MADWVAPEEALERAVDPPARRIDRIPEEKRAGGPFKPVAEKVRLAERRLRMAQMAAGGMVLRQIAADLGVSIALVSQEIDALVDEYHARTLKSVGQKVARELAVLDMVQMEATLAWFESKQGRVTNTRKRKAIVRSSFQRGAGGRKDVVRAANVGVKPNIGRLEAEARIEEDIRAMFADEDSQAAFGAKPEPGLLSEFGDDEEGQLAEAEETERTETSAGASEFLKIILECHEKRCRLEGLYKAELGDDGAYTALTPQQRAGRILALAQDLRAAKALQERAQTPNADEYAGATIDVQPVNGNGNNGHTPS